MKDEKEKKPKTGQPKIDEPSPEIPKNAHHSLESNPSEDNNNFLRFFQIVKKHKENKLKKPGK